MCGQGLILCGDEKKTTSFRVVHLSAKEPCLIDVWRHLSVSGSLG